MSARSAMAVLGAGSCTWTPSIRRFEPELQQLTMNSWSAPQWVLLAHPPDEIAQLPLNSWPAWPTSRFPAPVGPKSRSLPPQDGGWLNNLGQTEQARPHSGHPNHQGSVTCPELETF